MLLTPKSLQVLCDFFSLSVHFPPRPLCIGNKGLTSTSSLAQAVACLRTLALAVSSHLNGLFLDTLMARALASFRALLKFTSVSFLSLLGKEATPPLCFLPQRVSDHHPAPELPASRDLVYFFKVLYLRHQDGAWHGEGAQGPFVE